MSEFEDSLNSILNDPRQMGKIAQMAKTLMGGDGPREEQEIKEEAAASFGKNSGLDLGSIAKISKIFSEVKQENDDKTALLQAMEPYLNDKRRSKMEKGIKLARLAKIAKLALGEFGGDEDV